MSFRQSHTGPLTNPRNRFYSALLERLQALSVNQDLLARNEWHGIDLEQLVKGQLAPFVDQSAKRVTVRGPALRLTAAAAQAIGMAMHELATNASKYGALLAPEGTIDVGWFRANGRFDLTWREHGGPPVAAPNATGFGTFVLKAMAEQALNASITLEYDPSGLIWRLTTALENVIDHSGGAISD